MTSLPILRGLGSAAFLGICLTLVGCSRSDTPPLAPVSGVVTFSGKPLTQGSVQFIPDRDKGTLGRMAVGQIQPDGSFSLTTQKQGDGAQVGYHVVVVQAYQDVPAPAGYHSPYLSKSLIPVKYAEPDKSDLRAEVKAGDRNMITLELQK